MISISIPGAAPISLLRGRLQGAAAQEHETQCKENWFPIDSHRLRSGD
jgi:hypothetical protein